MPDQELEINPIEQLEGPDLNWRIAVDQSTRWPVLVFIASAVFWLVLGSLFALLASLKLHLPEFLGGSHVWSFGAVRPAHLATVIYGWLSMGGVGLAVWLWARVLRTPLRGAGLVLTAAGLWNLGMLYGTTALLAGYSRGIEYLEMPAAAFALIFTAMLLVSTSILLTLRHRTSASIYISGWYLAAAAVWAPFLFFVAMLPTPNGIGGAATNWWYVRSLLGLWLTPVGLAAAYYFIPKVTGRAIYSYQLSYLGFWTFALFFGWTGMHHLVGSAVPQWAQVLSVAFSALMIVPVVIVALNHHQTMRGQFRLLRYSPTLRFVVFGAVSFTVTCLLGTLQAFPFWQEVTHFTHYTVAHAHLGTYAFATMMLFGAFYYVLPRLTGWEWSSPRLVSAWFWTAAAGILLYFGALSVGGIIQGFRMLDPSIPFASIVAGTKPWLLVGSLSGILMTAAHVLFAVLVYRIIRHHGAPALGPVQFHATEATQAG